MNQDVILGFIRHLLTFGGGFAASNGLVTADEVTTAVGAVVTLVGIIWSAYSKKKTA